MSKSRFAGGVDPQEDVTKVIPGLSGMADSYSSWDVAHGAYVFEYITGFSAGAEKNSAKKMAEALAQVYAQRFAEWLGHVFLNRANMTRKSKVMTELTDGMSTWVESIPKMLDGKASLDLKDYMTTQVERFLDMKKIDQIGDKVFKAVQSDWMSAQSGNFRNANLGQLPITYNPRTKVYEIPKSQMTFPHRRKLRDLGFDFDGKVWSTETLDSDIMRALPQAGQLQNGAPVPQADPIDTEQWFFGEWLPSNISRFTKVFNTYGKSEDVPYEFKFSVSGNEVTVDFRRNIKTVEDAVREIKSRYGKQKDRGGWLQAVRVYEKLKRSRGMASMHLVDMANNLEHTHGAMNIFRLVCEAGTPSSSTSNTRRTSGRWSKPSKILTSASSPRRCSLRETA